MQIPGNPNIAASLGAMRSAILDRNAALRAAADAVSPASRSTDDAGSGPFQSALGAAVAQVNNAQADATAAASALERGQTTDVAAVMMARQRAAVGFEATMQVRNRLLTAYQDIINMPL